MKNRFLKIQIAVLVLLILSACGEDRPKKESDHSMHDMHGNSGSASNYADSVNNGLIANDTLKGSPERTAMNTIGGAHVHIEYHSPGVKNRIVWGGLVPYNQVWVTGAHSATSIQLSKPIQIGETKVDKGTYAIFTIPGEKAWVFILNKNYEQHLTDDYTDSLDVVRLTVKPVSADLTQRLTYEVNKVDDANGLIVMRWEKIKIEVPFKTIQ
jgi:Protein of unknown function (DUF2911)